MNNKARKSYATIQFSDATHKLIKQFCKANAFKINRWAEKVLLKELSKPSVD